MATMELQAVSKILLTMALIALADSSAQSKYMGPYKMTFASADPVNAQLFAMKYFGASFVQQPHKGGDGECAMVKWVEFNNTYSGYYAGYMWHFVKGYNRPNGTMTLDDFEQQLYELHGTLTNTTWDQFMDFRVTMWAADLDPFVAAFHRDGVPFMTRKLRVSETEFEYSLFVEVPHAILIELVGPKMTAASAQEWDFCAGNLSVSRPARAVVNETVARRFYDAEIPDMQPLRTSYASPDPLASAEFVRSLWGGELDHQTSAPLYPGNGSCYTEHSLLYTNPGAAHANTYQIRRIRAPNKRTFRNLSVTNFSAYLKRTHHSAGSMGINGSGDVYDEWMDNHIGITFDSLDGVIERLWEKGVPFFTRGQYGKFIDIFFEGPFGQIYEGVAPKQTLLSPSQIEDWNLCAATAGSLP